MPYRNNYLNRQRHKLFYIVSSANQARFKVSLEDKGQDLLHFITDDDGVVLEVKPSFGIQSELYKGAIIPIDLQVIGERCMIHHPPHIEFGYLKYNVESITDV